MLFEPKKITREHVLEAIKEIEENRLDLTPSTQWDVIIDGKAYPPKDVLRYAHKQMNGEILWDITGGEATNTYLDELGFLIRAKNDRADQIRTLIQEYKKTLDLSEFSNKDEKWYFVQRYKDNVDPTNPSFAEAFGSIKFANFAYRIAPAVIKEILSNEPVRYQQCIIKLFNEDIDLTERIKMFIQEVEAIYRKMHPEHNNSSHHDERTIATFLTLRDPKRYTFFMDTFYRNFCGLMGVKPKATKGDKYVHYLKYMQEFNSQYVVAEQELVSLARQTIPSDAYPDSDHLLLSQDIVFRLLGKDSTSVNDNPDAVKIDESDGVSTNPVQSTPRITYPLNQILYGPPGTGKTYNSINLAVQVTDPEFMSKITDMSSSRAAITTRYRQLVEEGRIVFTTFHQSMSYEDFIEGIKPVTRADGVICYEVVPGIFKKLCNQASQAGFTDSVPNRPDSITGVESGNRINIQEFDKLFDLFLEKLPPDSETEHSDIVLYTSNKDNPFEVFRTPGRPTVVVRAGNQRYANSIAKKELLSVYNNEKEPYYPSYEPILIGEILKMRHVNIDSTAGLSFDRAFARLSSDLEKQPGKVMKIRTPKGAEFGISLNSKENLTVHTAPAFKPSVTLTKENLLAHASGGEVPPYDKGYFQGVLYILSSNYGYEDADHSTAPIPTQNATQTQPYVLIIDEINRGNVSQIFGELITLIEPDKRAGMREALEAVLPYSKERFSVPANLHIIGTMNTADRSVEALDTALRRRFSFCEMTPEYDLLNISEYEGISLKSLLEKINFRIEGLLDKDHAIGHSYFLRVAKKETSLKKVFFNEIIPLLQEYFYGNYGRIELVLGSEFVDAITYKPSDYAAASPDNDGVADSIRYRLVGEDQMQNDDDFVRALRVLLNEQ